MSLRKDPSPSSAKADAAAALSSDEPDVGATPRAEAEAEEAPAEPEPTAVLLDLPPDYTLVASDGTPYRSSPGVPVLVPAHHVQELLDRGARTVVPS